MKCPTCGANTYTAISGKQICPQCGYGAAHYMPPPPATAAMPDRREQPIAEEMAVPPERRAYREAGHAVMSYLIRHGFTTRVVPIDRSLILPAFTEVSIEASSTPWAQTTFSLGSLLTVPQVLVAGDLAERRKYEGPGDRPLPRTDNVKQAEHLLLAYLEEYGGGDAERLMHDVVQVVEEAMQTYWVCVEALVTALLNSKSLSQDKAFAIIEQQISGDAKQKARAVLEAAAKRFQRK